MGGYLGQTKTYRNTALADDGKQVDQFFNLLMSAASAASVQSYVQFWVDLKTVRDIRSKYLSLSNLQAKAL